MSTKIVYNGELIESSQVALEVMSDGLAFGFGLFETVKFLNGRPCFFREHIERLAKSAASSSMKFPYTFEDIIRQSMTLFEENDVQNGVFKIILIRSCKSDNVAVYIRDSEVACDREPIRLRLSNVIKSANAFTTRNKTLNYMENWLEKKAAEHHGYDECFFLNENYEATECSAANLFVVKENFLKTPSLDCGLLDGVIRSRVLRIASEAGLRIVEGILRPEECLEADEAFITNSGNGIVSVSEIYVDRLRTLPKVRSKLVKFLSDKLRIAEIASTQVFECK